MAGTIYRLVTTTSAVKGLSQVAWVLSVDRIKSCIVDGLVKHTMIARKSKQPPRQEFVLVDVLVSHRARCLRHFYDSVSSIDEVYSYIGIQFIVECATSNVAGIVAYLWNCAPISRRGTSGLNLTAMAYASLGKLCLGVASCLFDTGVGQACLRRMQWVWFGGIFNVERVWGGDRGDSN